VDPRGLRWPDGRELAVSRVFEGMTVGPTARVGVVAKGDPLNPLIDPQVV
jgi:hypothetical protein